MQLRPPILLAAVLLAFVAGSAQAHPDGSSTISAAVPPPASRAALLAWKPRAWTPVGATATRAAGMRVAIDPIDGTLSMPAADDATQLVVIDDGAPIPVRLRANGSRFAILDDRFAEFSVVTLGPDGKPSWSCVHGPQGAAQFHRQPHTAPVPVTSRTPAAGTVWEDK